MYFEVSKKGVLGATDNAACLFLDLFSSVFAKSFPCFLYLLFLWLRIIPLTLYSSVEARGDIVESIGPNQETEMHAKSFDIIGRCNMDVSLHFPETCTEFDR